MKLYRRHFIKLASAVPISLAPIGLTKRIFYDGSTLNSQSLTTPAVANTSIQRRFPSKTIRTRLGLLKIELLSDGEPRLSRPWGMNWLSDGRMLVTERYGNLRILDLQSSTKLLSPPLQGVPNVRSQGQGGLLDVLTPQNIKKNDTAIPVYLTYAKVKGSDGTTALAKGYLKDDRLVDLTDIFIAQPYYPTSHHFGSRLAWSKDGHLLICIGDRGNRHEAQNLHTHLGAVLKLQTTGQAALDNPFINDKYAKPEIYSLGHRNPQGLAVDLDNDRIWLHEHGPKGGDEINLIRKGMNFGWPEVTSGREYSGGYIGPELKSGFASPQHHWTPSIAPSGMAFVTDSNFDELNGHLLVGSLKFQELHFIQTDGEKIVNDHVVFRKLIGRIRDISIGPDGWIYLLNDEKKGGIYRVRKA